MSKLRKISIITILLWSFLVGATYAATATINVSAARLREEANTTSNILTNIYKGEKVEILEKNGEWYKVKYESNVGYLKNNLIKEDVAENSQNNNESTNKPAEVTDSSKVTVNADVKVRFVPNLTSSAIMNATAGKEFTKLAEVGSWVQVTDGIATGWVLKTKIATDPQTVNPSDFEDSSNENKVSENKVSENKNTVSNTNTTKESNKVAENKVNNTVKENDTKTNQTSTAVNKNGIVNVETAKVREKADKSSKVLGFLDYNDKITITAEEGEWYKFTEKEISGYVHKTLVTVKTDEEISSRHLIEERQEETDNTTVNTTTNETVNNALQTENAVSSNGQSVVDYAKQFLGYPYVVGGKNPTTGFDCSGFTRYIYLNFGYSLGATAATQNNIGTEVSRSDLQPGDLILFYDEAKIKIGHTGVYISNGDFIHAANPKRGVVTDNLNTNSYYNERYITARRIVK